MSQEDRGMPTDITSTQVESRDGTTLAVDTIGDGPPVILVGGSFNDRSTVAALSALLAPAFTAVTYYRRARGDSDDKSQHYSAQNEIDDLAAVIDSAGGRAGVFGHSSGGVLALEGVLHGLSIDRLALYETPYVTDSNGPVPPDDNLERLIRLLDAEDHDAAAATFLQENVGMPPEVVSMMRSGDAWNFMVHQAGGLPYDVLVYQSGVQLPTERLASVAIHTLAVYGENTWPWLAQATRAVADAIPRAELATLEGEDHSILQRPHALVPLLTNFFR